MSHPSASTSRALSSTLSNSFSIYHRDGANGLLLNNLDFDFENNKIPLGKWFAIHRNMAMLVFSLVQNSRSSIDGLREAAEAWSSYNPVQNLGNYRNVVNIFLDYIKTPLDWASESERPVIAMNIAKALEQDSCGVLQYLSAFLRDKEVCYPILLNCELDLRQGVLDLMQSLLDSHRDSGHRPMIAIALQRLSRTFNLHPTCFSLSGVEIHGFALAHGGFASVYKGQVGGQQVAVKLMRTVGTDETKERARKRFGREAVQWGQLSHQNVLPFMGMYHIGGEICLVSPWIDNGNVAHFVRETKPDTRTRISLILDVAHGLEYLHSADVGIVHGDITGANILVCHDGRACIADFGLSIIVEAEPLLFPHSTTSAQGGVPQYEAPELMAWDSARKTFESDVYGFAMTSFEILSGTVPFLGMIWQDIFSKVPEGLRPSWPKDVAPPLDAIWELLQACWDKNPDARLTVPEIITRLANSPIGGTPTQLGAAWDDTSGSRVRRASEQWPHLPSANQILDRCRPGHPTPLTFVNQGEEEEHRTVKRAKNEAFERAYQKNPKPTAAEREAMGALYGQKRKQVDTWFTSRRRQAKEADRASVGSSLSAPLPYPHAPDASKHRRFTPEEDAALRAGYRSCGPAWAEIALNPVFARTGRGIGRTSTNLRDRFRKAWPDEFKRAGYPNGDEDSVEEPGVGAVRRWHRATSAQARKPKRRRFTQEEDEALLAGYNTHGPKWAEIAAHPPFLPTGPDTGRTDASLREHFSNKWPERYQAEGFKVRPRKMDLPDGEGMKAGETERAKDTPMTDVFSPSDQASDKGAARRVEGGVNEVLGADTFHVRGRIAIDDRALSTEIATALTDMVVDDELLV